MAITNETIIDAIFAMDAYDHNPDDGAWIDTFRKLFPGLSNGLLGDYVVSNVSTSSQNANNNFFAIAYTSSSGTVIAYRGTTYFSKDLVNGYGIGAGFAGGPDATNAVTFYQQVAGANDSTWQSNPNITVVGHSLGGGMAGYVGAIYGLNGVLFDNMTFNSAASSAYSSSIPTTIYDEFGNATVIPGNATLSAQTYGTQTPYPNDLSKLSAYATTGELLSVLLFLRAYQTPSVQYLNSYGGSSASPSWATQLHSMALLTMLIYAQAAGDTAWQSVGKAFVAALFNDSLAAAIVGSGGDSALMQKIIAYSALSSGYMPFGDTGIQSLFSDADTLGNLVSSSQLVGILSDQSITNALAEILVQYSGDLAAQAQTNTSFVGDFAANAGVLDIDLDPTRFQSTYQDGEATIVGASDFGFAVWQQLISGSSGFFSGNSALVAVLKSFTSAVNNFVSAGGITEILAATAVGANLDGTVAPSEADGQPGEAILVGYDGSGTLLAGDTNNLVIGGGEVVVGDGNNIIVGETGNETFVLGRGNNTLIESSGHASVDYSNVDQPGKSSSFVLSSSASGGIVVSKTAPGKFGGVKSSGTDYLYNVENLIFGAGADYVTVLPGTDLTNIKSIDGGGSSGGTEDVLDLSNYDDALQLINNHIIGKNIDIAISNFEQVKLPSLGDTDKLTTGSIDKLYTGDGNDTVVAVPDAMFIDLGGGNNTLTGGGGGDVVTGSGTDTIEISHNGQLLFEGAKPTDHLTNYGVILTGGVRWTDSESIWAYGTHGERYARNQQGDLVIDDGSGNETFIPDFNFNIDSGAQTAGLYVIQVTINIVGYDSWTAPFRSAASILSALQKINRALYGDPLVLDLAGNGIQLSDQQASGVSFDINNNGFAAGVGWIGQGNGFLVRDINGDGQIDNVSEMFGGASGNGFADLAALDGNHDGVISAADNGLADFNGDGKIDASDTFDDLEVWVDANGNGVVDPGELYTMSELGIVSISLGTTLAGSTINGNTILSTATFHYANGTTGTIADVALATDDFDTTWLGDSTVSAAAALRPELKGFGTLTSLRIAMTLDPALITTVDAALAWLNTLSQSQSSRHGYCGAPAASATSSCSVGFAHAACPIIPAIVHNSLAGAACSRLPSNYGAVAVDKTGTLNAGWLGGGA